MLQLNKKSICVLQGGDLLDWTSRDGGIQEDSFIQRIEALSTMGYSVLLSNYSRYFSLASYLSTFTKQSIVISMGIPSVRVGGILSSCGDCWHPVLIAVFLWGLLPSCGDWVTVW